MPPLSRDPTNCRWKTKKTMATGMVVSTAAPRLSGNWLPVPRLPWNSARPLVSVYSLGESPATRKAANSFQELWKDRALGDEIADPTVTLVRRREVLANGLR